MQEIGLMENKEAGYSEFDNYISNGMMLQLRRILPGDDIEEDHMRNRQLVASWAFDRGTSENVIERKLIDGKTYFVVNDYDKLRGYFGELLNEIQRIKSEGDFAQILNSSSRFSSRCRRSWLLPSPWKAKGNL